MTAASFSKRFKELVRGLNDTELGFVLGVSADAARKMRNGDIKSLKLQAALRLARELKISPWYIAGEVEPATPLMVGPPDEKLRRKGGRKVGPTLDQAALQTAESALLLHDEVVELRARVRRLEAAVEALQSHATTSSAR
jgi:transcriptional regulator with XRE-family HTH domain